MARVHGLPINNDPAKERVSRGLLNAHAVIVCLGGVVGILGIIQYFVLKPNQDKWNASMGNVRESPVVGAWSQVVILSMQIAVPLAVYLLVRWGIRENSTNLLTGIYMFDGYCTCCVGLTILSAIGTAVLYNWAKDSMSNVTCYDTFWVDAEGTSHKDMGTGYTKAKCEDVKAAVVDSAPVYVAFSAVQAVIAIFEITVCAFATYQANSAQHSLRQGEVFCGPPSVPVTAAMQPQYATGTVVVGKPISSGP